MYQFSRAIYRALAPRVLEDCEDPGGTFRRLCVHEACEAAIVRLARDHRYFARPARTLFQEVRHHFSLNDQPTVYRLIDWHIQMALVHIAHLPPTVDPLGEPRVCQASTRKGTPCRREPLPGRDYCPSHKHLEVVHESELEPQPSRVSRTLEPLAGLLGPSRVGATRREGLANLEAAQTFRLLLAHFHALDPHAAGPHGRRRPATRRAPRIPRTQPRRVRRGGWNPAGDVAGLALRRIVSRKKTPWTWPETTTRRRIKPSSIGSIALVVVFVEARHLGHLAAVELRHRDRRRLHGQACQLALAVVGDGMIGRRRARGSGRRPQPPGYRPRPTSVPSRRPRRRPARHPHASAASARRRWELRAR